MSKNILITNASERYGVALAVDLRRIAGEFHTVGTDSHPNKLQRAQTDIKILMPSAHEPDYIETLHTVVEEHDVDLVIVTREVEMQRVARERVQAGTRTFLPPVETFDLCKDKNATYDALHKAGVPVPPSMFIDDPDDLQIALNELGPDIWLRHIGGAGGKGSLPVNSMKAGVAWIDMNEGWGKFMAATRLSERTVTWESIWVHGRLIAAQTRARHYWELAGLAPSGVTGIAGSAETVSNKTLDEISLKAIKAVDPEPHGLMGVDMTYDHDGNALVTEINAGRFMNNGVLQYAPVLEAHETFQYLAVMAGLGEIPDNWTPRINPLPAGLICVTGLNVEPVLLTSEELEKTKQDMDALRARVARKKAS